MNIEIFCIGSSPKPHEVAWMDTYLKRAKPFGKIRLTRIRERPTSAKTWNELKTKLPKDCFRVVLDDGGKLRSTEEFSKLFDRAGRAQKKNIAFLIGGSYGFPKEATASADELLSLTPLTLPHRLALLILCEQLYRVLSWRAGAPYHHGS